MSLSVSWVDLPELLGFIEKLTFLIDFFFNQRIPPGGNSTPGADDLKLSLKEFTLWTIFQIVDN